MKKIISTISALLLVVGTFAGNTGSEKYTVKKDNSSIEWTGKKVTGSHNGTISIKEGNLTLENGMIVNGSLTIDMNTIVVTDIEDEKTNNKLKGHLSSDDFFGVEKNPTSTLKITKVEKKEGNLHHIHGELTIKGHTEKVEIPTTILTEGDKIVAVGELEINRTLYDIKYGSGSFFDNLGDKAIDDNFTIKFKVAAVK